MYRFPPPKKPLRFDEHRALDHNILLFLEWYIGKNGKAPTVREIAKAQGGKATSTVQRSLTRLEDMGYTTRVDGTLRLTAKLWKE